jgi:uncharacterized protein
MKKRITTTLAALVAALPFLLPIPDAMAQTDPAGLWHGAIRLPNGELNIEVKLDQANGSWTGVISIPAQGLKDYALHSVKVAGSDVGFVMPKVPGNPTFHGTLSMDGQKMEGDFTQGNAKLRFVLARMSQSELGAAEAKLAERRLLSTWQGALKIGPAELRLVLRIFQARDGGLSGMLDSIDQGGKDLEVDQVTLTDTQLTFEMKQLSASFAGRLNPERNEATGEWRQGGQVLPLVLKKTDQPAGLRRPQEPQPPFPYVEEEVSYRNEKDEVRLAGTLTFPLSGGTFPTVILISGSGAQDRNEAIMGHKPFLVLADFLTRKGIAVLRVDDRGVGGSSGRTDTSTTEDFAQDVLAGVRYLKTRKEVNGRKIGLVGHSEGGIVAPLAAAQSADIAFLVLMAGIGLPGERVLQAQGELLGRAAGLAEEDVARNRELQERLFHIVKSEPDRSAAERLIRESIETHISTLGDEQKKTAGASQAFIDMQIAMTLSPWFRFFLNYDPRPALRKVKVPVLAINGTLDLQVPADENLEAIAAALKEAGNTDYKTMVLPGLNHLFQTAKSGTVDEYAVIEETIAPSVLELIAAWILER